MTQTAVLERKQEQEQKKIRVVLLSDAMIQKIKSPKFQRVVDSRRIPLILQAMTKGIFIPPVTLAEIEGDLFILDGQHRLEARRKVEFPLYAVIVPMNYKEAATNFITINSTSSRVSIQHRLAVDPSKESEEIRKIAEEMGATPVQVYALLNGLRAVKASTKGYSLDGSDARHFELARQILAYWTNDSRWKREQRVIGRKSTYSHTGMLKVLGRLVARAKKPMDLVKLVHDKLDFHATSTFGQKVGSSYLHQQQMLDYIKDTILFKEL